MKDNGIRQSMSRRGNCRDNAPQENFFGHMKDHLMERIENARKFQQVKDAVDDYMDYYNNERYVWDLAYLSPNEYYKFVKTGKYPLDIPNPPKSPVISKKPDELGKKNDSEAEQSAEDKCSLKQRKRISQARLKQRQLYLLVSLTWGTVYDDYL